MYAYHMCGIWSQLKMQFPVPNMSKLSRHKQLQEQREQERERRTCGTKVNHKFQRLAERAAARVNLQYSKSRIVAYPCPYCGGWHIGNN